ncbi:MAG: LLM class flavin-dependent oxidoreductase [Deltaproteobacteria bacterium]|nr:LLM class flavin-dependent oxidoreductase [Deltaproteobacteria bacterium]
MIEDVLKLDGSLRCGMVVAAGSPDDLKAQAARIEAAGLDSIWVGDHVSFHIPILESLTLLSFLAAATERVRLCTGVYLLPLRHPTLIAKITSTLDQLAGGRLTLGVGVGGEFPPEFDAVGVPVAERGTRADEAIEILRRLWAEDRVEHHGRHFDLGPVSIDPKPLQPGGPRIVVGGRKGPTFRRAGRLGDGYISHMCSAEQYTANMKEIAGHAHAAGRDGVEFETASFLFTVLDDDHDKALDRAAKLLGMIYNRPFEDAARKYCLLGRPEDMLEQLEGFAKAGSRHFVFSMLSDAGEFVDAFENGIRPGLASVGLR